jgi:carbonic anhydrase
MSENNGSSNSSNGIEEQQQSPDSTSVPTSAFSRGVPIHWGYPLAHGSQPGQSALSSVPPLTISSAPPPGGRVGNQSRSLSTSSVPHSPSVNTTASSATAPTSPVTGPSSPQSGTSPQQPSFSSPSPAAYTPLTPSRSVENRSELSFLFDNNRQWARSVEAAYPGFFAALSQQQKPKYMWIGCSDSRVPASEITGLMPGEVFVHRNVANCVVHADLNMLSCLQLAVDVLKVEHVVVCGHYGCGGVNFALSPTQVGLADNWIRHIKDVARQHKDELGKHAGFQQKSDRLVELNVVAQVENVCHTTIVQNAWRRGQALTVHGWVYGVHNGLLKNLVDPSIKGFDQISPAFHVDGPVGIQEP